MLKKGNRANTLHGILLIVLFSFAAFYIAGFPLVKKLSFSPLIVGIVLGMLYANSLRNKLPETWVPGIRFCTKQVLRWGIILYGFRLTLSEVAAVGIPAVAVDLVVVTVTILGGILLGRLLKIDRDTALMTSTGSAICGGQRNGSDRYAGNRRDGHHHQDDPCDDARARAGYPGVRAGAPPENRRGAQ